MIWRVFGLIRVYPRRYTTGSVRALELYFKKKGFPLPPCKMFATWLAADATKKHAEGKFGKEILDCHPLQACPEPHPRHDERHRAWHCPPAESPRPLNHEPPAPIRQKHGGSKMETLNR